MLEKETKIHMSPTLLVVASTDVQTMRFVV